MFVEWLYKPRALEKASKKWGHETKSRQRRENAKCKSREAVTKPGGC